MTVKKFDPDWFLLSLAWRDLTWSQKQIIIWRARRYVIERRARRAWVIAKAEAAGVIWFVPTAFYLAFCLMLLEVI